MIESPLAHLSDEQIEELGKEFDAIHDEVFDDLGDRDRTLHRRDDRDAPPPRGARARPAVRLALPAGLAGRDRDALAGQDPREHGDRPQRHARPVGLDERPPDPLLDLGLGLGVDARGVEALPQLRPPHLHEHPRQGQGPRLRDHADRPAPDVEPGLPGPAALQPGAGGVLRVGRRLPRPRLRADPQGREVQGAGRCSELKGMGKQGLDADRQGLHRLPGAVTAARQARLQVAR